MPASAGRSTSRPPAAASSTSASGGSFFPAPFKLTDYAPPPHLSSAARAPPRKRRRVFRSPSPPFAPDDPSPDAVAYNRYQATLRLSAAWERVIARYSAVDDDAEDEIDLSTGEVVLDRGFVRGMARRRWGGESGSEGDGEEGQKEAWETDEDELGGADDPDTLDNQFAPPAMVAQRAQDADDLAEFLAAEAALRNREESPASGDDEDDDEVEFISHTRTRLDLRPKLLKEGLKAEGEDELALWQQRERQKQNLKLEDLTPPVSVASTSSSIISSSPAPRPLPLPTAPKELPTFTPKPLPSAPAPVQCTLLPRPPKPAPAPRPHVPLPRRLTPSQIPLPPSPPPSESTPRRPVPSARARPSPIPIKSESENEDALEWVTPRMVVSSSSKKRKLGGAGVTPTCRVPGKGQTSKPFTSKCSSTPRPFGFPTPTLSSRPDSKPIPTPTPTHTHTAKPTTTLTPYLRAISISSSSSLFSSPSPSPSPASVLPPPPPPQPTFTRSAPGRPRASSIVSIESGEEDEDGGFGATFGVEEQKPRPFVFGAVGGGGSPWNAKKEW